MDNRPPTDIMDKEKQPVDGSEQSETTEGIISSTGHRQEVQRHFSTLSILGVGVATGNCWAGFGGTLAVAISNGGPPGVLYEFILTSLMYSIVAASIAELASAVPSSGGVYHFASVSGSRHGRLTGWFAGWWNYLAYQFGIASVSSILGKQLVVMYGLFRPEFEYQAWHALIGYLIMTWATCCVVLFFNRALPSIEKMSIYLVVGGVFVSILVCAIMPHVKGRPYASNDFVWRQWQNQTGWSSNGLVFMAGCLNGAYGMGTPDVEEVPRPSRNIPKAIMFQMLINFSTCLLYLITIFYALTDLDAVIAAADTFPLTTVYHQATGSAGGALGLTIVIFCSLTAGTAATYITAGRTLWTLARDGAVPFSNVFGRIHPTMHNPFNATLACGVVSTVLSAIFVASDAAFNAFAASYAIFSTLSYLAAILPHLLSRRSHVEPGEFWMRGWVGYAVNIIGCLYMMVFIVIYCFPFTYPVDVQSMNYVSVLCGGLSIFIAGWWLVKKDKYEGPKFIGKNGASMASES
ncbi:MAG: hypothetical protein Q9168_005189 [Polycauliona sp. 1 TL-2023]